MNNELFLSPADDLQAALDNAPNNAFVHLTAGIYHQKIVIRTPGLRIVGQGAQNTIIEYSDYAQKLDEQGREYITFRTYTVAVCADGVHMEDLGIVNNALSPETKGQEVALTVYGDEFSMERCHLRSTQDTLFLGPLPPDLIQRYDGFLMDELRGGKLLRQSFTNCLIEGTVDFIFGCGEAVFDDCEIRSLSDARDIGYIAAPAHSEDQVDGFLFRHCRLTCEPGVTPGSIYLARPWRDYGLVRFENCTMDKHIAPAGFDKWNDTHRDKTARFYESPAVAGRVRWINRNIAD